MSSGGCRSRVLSVPRIRRETGRGRRLRRGADRHTDAVGRRFQRPCGGARRESRASRGGGFGTRGVGSRGFLGARLCGVPAQALYGQRADCRAGRRLRRGKGPKRRGYGRRGEKRRCGNCRRRGRTRQCGEACRQEGSGRCGGQCGGGFGGRCEFRPPDGLCGRRCGGGARDSGILRRTERRELPAARTGARKRRRRGAESRGAQDAADLHDAGGGRSRRDAAYGRKLGGSADRRPARRDRCGGGKYPCDCRGSAKKVSLP